MPNFGFLALTNYIISKLIKTFPQFNHKKMLFINCHAKIAMPLMLGRQVDNLNSHGWTFQSHS